MKTRERLKSILIVVLIVGAAYLTYATWFYNSPMERVSLLALLSNRVENAFSGGEENPDTGVVFYPLAASMKQESGRFGARYDEEAVRTIFDRTYALFGEALGSATAPRAVEEKAWREALGKPGVLYDYQSVIPAQVLAVWLGAVEYEDLLEYRARYLCLCVENGEVALYLKANDTCARFETALEAGDVVTATASVAPNGAKLAGESKQLVAPELLVRTGEIRPARLRASAVTLTETNLSAMLRVFGFNPNTVSRYVERDGTQVYIEDINTVRFTPDGRIVYTDSREESEFGAGIFVPSVDDVPTLTEQLETARLLVTRLDAELGSAGRLYLYGIQEQADAVEFEFGRAVDGIPVDRQGTGYVARVTVTKNKVTEVSCLTRIYEGTSETDPVLPWNLAIAALRGNVTSGELGLRYLDTGAETLSASWYFKP